MADRSYDTTITNTLKVPQKLVGLVFEMINSSDVVQAWADLTPEGGTTTTHPLKLNGQHGFEIDDPGLIVLPGERVAISISFVRGGAS